MNDSRKKYFRRTVLIGAGIIVALSLITVSVFHLTAPDSKPVPVAGPLTPAPTVEIDTKLLLDALLRTWAIDQACYDRKNNVYFVHIAEHASSEQYWDEGWYKVPVFTFTELENHTWYLDSYSGWQSVSPDVTGLTCKTQIPGASWFKE